ncbi:hypothetical protein ACHAXA_008432 [Cyclostephanos tholiformis]|uniref:Uncharacterized protein n=1 Tax=Cyclostephanos tholiformis TaxID=382380 RepID=A0ABD3SBX8_9STRA
MCMPFGRRSSHRFPITISSVSRHPICMPSIAVADSTGEVVVGVIRDPHRNETYAAMRGRGATLNGVAIRLHRRDDDDDDDGGTTTTTTTSSLGDAIIAMGSPPATESMNMSLLALPALMPRVRTIRMLGSAALMLAWVANGRLAAYWRCDESSSGTWPRVASSSEAGGRVTDLEDEVDFGSLRRVGAGSGNPGRVEGGGGRMNEGRRRTGRLVPTE